MSARPGGEAAKFGETYEGAWTIRHLLYVLSGRADAIIVEDTGDRGRGAEFTFFPCGRPVEVHQVKRAYKDFSGWNASRLHKVGVLENARMHVEDGRQFHFVSEIPIVKINKLADRARRAADLTAFRSDDWMTSGLEPEFARLSTIYESDQVALQVLQGLWPECESESSIRRTNEVLAGLYLEGASPATAALGLGDLAKKYLGVHLDAARIEALLPEYELRRSPHAGSPALAEAVAETLTSWKGSITSGLLQPVIPRTEARELVSALRGAAGQIFAVVGEAGSGKSAVLLQAVSELEADDCAVLGFRLDHRGDFTTAKELGRSLDLQVSPVAALAATARARRCLLVVDQLDAVSAASGRMHRRFSVIADLIRQAKTFPQMSVVLACRAFDIDNDERIGELVKAEDITRCEVAVLSDEQIDQAVEAMNLPVAQLTDVQRSLLELPFNLVLLRAISGQDDALKFTSAGGLLNAFWKQKQRDCTNRREHRTQFVAVISAVVEVMSARQVLTVPMSVLDEKDLGPDAEVLASEHVLVLEKGSYSFFHERFFDYAFARLWTSRNDALADFLLQDDQELFRRAQVRQVLQYIRDEDRRRFILEADALLAHPEIRFHIKALVFGVLRALPDPSAAEWRLIERRMATDGPLTPHLMNTIRTLPWFDRLDEEGVMASWLAAGDDTAQERIKDVLLGAVKERPDRMAALIAPHAGQTPHYLEWLRWITRFARVYDSRPLFDLVLEAVRRGDYTDDRQLELTIGGLGQQQPTWAVEYLVAWFAERPGALTLDRRGRVTALKSREHNLVELIRAAAEQAPAKFCQALVSYLLQVMSLTEGDPGVRPIIDPHFSFRSQPAGPMDEADEVLLRSTAAALRTYVTQDPSAVEPLLEVLASDPHDGAQWLLYESFRTGGDRWADWSAKLLLEGDHRFVSGYRTDEWWTTRQLMQVITPHVSDEDFSNIEKAVMSLQPTWESRQGAGWASFVLLGALASDRLSEAGRRRLGELRRRFRRDEPAVPRDLVGGLIRSPIPQDAAQWMNDDQWLGAMNKHRTDKTDLDSLTGGVRELSQILRTEATKDPDRFARLTLRLTEDTATNYSNAVLQALGDAKMPVEPGAAFAAVRHIASFRNSDNDLSLSWSMSRQLESEIPDDIIAILLDRALHAVDPSEEFWPETADYEDDPDDYSYESDVYGHGMNTARGAAALMLGNIVLHDTDGHVTCLVAPSLDQLANDPSLAVRSCVAHLIAACLRHANEAALAAFTPLLAANDFLLTARPVTQLISYVGSADPAMIEPVVIRMLNSANPTVRRAGGAMAAYAGLTFGMDHLLAAACQSDDAPVRRGTAETCAHLLARTANIRATPTSLIQFFADTDHDVRKAAAQVAGLLRGQDLHPFSDVLTALIESPAFADALSQLRLTLEAATDRTDDIAVAYIRRFISEFRQDAGNIATSAAHEAPAIIDLALRAYDQAPDKAPRAQALDLIDELLLINAYGAADAVDAAER